MIECINSTTNCYSAKISQCLIWREAITENKNAGNNNPLITMDGEITEMPLKGYR